MDEEGQTATKDILGERFLLPSLLSPFLSSPLLSLPYLRDRGITVGLGVAGSTTLGLMPRTYSTGSYLGLMLRHVVPFFAHRDSRFHDDRCLKRALN